MVNLSSQLSADHVQESSPLEGEAKIGRASSTYPLGILNALGLRRSDDGGIIVSGSPDYLIANDIRPYPTMTKLLRDKVGEEVDEVAGSRSPRSTPAPTLKPHCSPSKPLAKTEAAEVPGS